jgi:hypothetical protein
MAQVKQAIHLWLVHIQHSRQVRFTQLLSLHFIP